MFFFCSISDNKKIKESAQRGCVKVSSSLSRDDNNHYERLPMASLFLSHNEFCYKQFLGLPNLRIFDSLYFMIVAK